MTLSREYQSLIEELQAMITEGEFGARWQLIECYHTVGRRILEFKADAPEEWRNTLARDLGRSERTIQYAVQFARTYPDIQSLPEGKSISWTKVTRMLDGKNPKPAKLEEPCNHSCPRHCKT